MSPTSRGGGADDSSGSTQNPTYRSDLQHDTSSYRAPRSDPRRSGVEHDGLASEWCCGQPATRETERHGVGWRTWRLELLLQGRQQVSAHAAVGLGPGEETSEHLHGLLQQLRVWGTVGGLRSNEHLSVKQPCATGSR